MNLKTTDLSDKYPDTLQIAEPLFFHFGGKQYFSGPIETVHAPGDNTKVRECLMTPGRGRVLVVDGDAGKDCALLGDMLATMGADNGWSGIVIHGCVRDSEELRNVPLGVMALAVHPKKSGKAGKGAVHTTLKFAGVTFQPSHFLYADHDGILVSETPLEL